MSKKEITLKPCPICGSLPRHRVEDMGTGSYQHYYGCTDHIYECPKCGIIHASGDTVYSKDADEAERVARTSWNKQCDKWEKTLSWRTPTDTTQEDTIKVSRVAVESAKRRVDDYLNIENSDYARGELSILNDILEGRFN